jgi:hypothetical protein
MFEREINYLELKIKKLLEHFNPGGATV